MAFEDLQPKIKRLAGRMRAAGVDGARLCLALARGDSVGDDPGAAQVEAILAPLAVDRRHYWIGALYTLLLAPEQRRRQAAYFTPPSLAKRLIALAEAQGCDLRTAQVLDPAAGGAAFLSTVAARMLELGRAPQDCAQALHGFDIDADLASLARVLVSQRLGIPSPTKLVATADSLKVDAGRSMDLVLVNPPYGRRTGAALEGVDWTKVASPGHVNIYALFIDLALRWAKPGGLVGVVAPSSFVGGPFYDRLRRHIRNNAQVLALGLVDDRDDLFLDVAQDVCLLLLRRRAQGHDTDRAVAFGSVGADGAWTDLGALPLPTRKTNAWTLPPLHAGEAIGGTTLADWGVAPQVGYFVWNREKERMRTAPESGAVPLFWAHNVRAGEVCQPRARKGGGVDYVAFDHESPAVLRGEALLLQRTTNSKQARRLVVGLLLARPEGYVTENHTILLRPLRPNVSLRTLAALLNTRAVDLRYRRLSGTASISAKLLKRLDLPAPSAFTAELAATPDDPEGAAERAYRRGRGGEKAAAA